MEKAPEAWFVNLGIEIYDLPRTFVKIFGFDIYWYAVLIAAGIAAGLFYAMQEAKRTGQNPDTYLDFVTYGFLSAFVCARLYYVVFFWENYKGNLLSIFNVRNGGLAIYGGVIGAVISAYVYAKINKIDFGVMLDTCAPGLVLGQAIGRWGNFFNREAFGSSTDSIFALRYIVNENQFVPPSVEIMDLGFASYIQVHPAFLYESVWNFGVFGLLLLLRKYKKFSGELFICYLAAYGFGRFFIEGIRTDNLMLFNTGIAVSQGLSALLVIASAAVIFCIRRKESLETF